MIIKKSPFYLLIIALIGFFIKGVYSDSSISSSLKPLTPLLGSSSERCRDELGSLHSVSKSGRYVVVVRTCFKQDWWDKRINKYDSLIEDDLTKVTIEEPSMVYIYDNVSGMKHSLYGPEPENPNRSGASVKSPTINDDGWMVSYVIDDGKNRSVHFVGLGGEGNPLSGKTQIASSGDNPFVSADGKYIVFQSSSKELINFSLPNPSGPLPNPPITTPRSIPQTQPAPQPKGDGGIKTSTGSGVPLISLTNFDRIFMFDTEARALKLITPPTADGSSSNPSVSADGSKVVFSSEASNLVPVDENKKEDIFLYDRNERTYTKISSSSIDPSGNSDGKSYSPMISADGKYIVYASDATNLVTFTQEPQWNIYLYDIERKTNRLLTLPESGTQTDFGSSWAPSLSADGKRVVFMSSRTDLISDWEDRPGMKSTKFTRIFLWDQPSNKFYVQSAKAYKAWSETGVMEIGWNHAYGDALFPSISADGETTIFEAKVNLTYPNALLDSFSWGMVYLKKGLGVRSGKEATLPLPEPPPYVTPPPPEPPPPSQWDLRCFEPGTPPACGCPYTPPCNVGPPPPPLPAPPPTDPSPGAY